MSTAPPVAGADAAAQPRHQRGPRRPGRFRWIAAGLAVVVVVAALELNGPRTGAPAPVGPAVPGLRFGATYTEGSLEPWEPGSARRRASAVLSAVAPVQNQSLMGWGALNPEPSPGVYAWDSLDQRIRTITSTGAEPVLTLCCAPDWMKGGTPGTTDWSRIEVAPDRAHYQAFASLAAAAARRYRAVHRFIVWNELKGFYDGSANEWDIAAYTDLYNAVYRAVKQVRPDAQVGGPYAVLDSWSSASVTDHPSAVRGPWGLLDQRPLDAISYWLQHAVGADFVAVDGGTATRDRGLVVSEFEATQKLAAATKWLRARTDLPVWWAEIYADTNPSDMSPGAPERAAVMADALVEVAKAGASVALLWQPQASDSLSSAALFTSTAAADGGRPLPLVSLLRFLGRQLRQDPRLVSTSWDGAARRFTVTVGERSMTWSASDGLSPPTRSGDR